MTSAESNDLRRELQMLISLNLHRSRFWPLCLLIMVVVTTTLMVVNALVLQVGCLIAIGACMCAAAYELIIRERKEQAALYLFCFIGSAAGGLGYLFHGGHRTAMLAVMSLYFTIISFGFTVHRAGQPRR